MLEPTLGFSGINLNVESSRTPMLVEEAPTPGSITEDSDTSVFPIAICLSESVRAFQFIPGFGLSVFIPNFTISPDFIGVEVVKMITP